MTRLPSILPPSDLLTKVKGIEAGLRRQRRVGAVGWLGVVVGAAIQLTVLLANSEWLVALLSADWSKVLDDWPLLLALFVLALSLVTVVWSRFWLQESREPFRYTFSVGTFAPAGASAKEPALGSLSTDLAEALSERIARLTRLDDEFVPVAADGAQEDERGKPSHIHISGYYARRSRPEDKSVLEVTPWVRIGGRGEPESLAHPVKFTSGKTTLNPTEYEQVLERVFASVATKVYAKIQEDVARKIELLPRRYFRAVAYFHEAEDYSRSNTLDAYTEARRLYERTLELYDPFWEDARLGLRRPLRRARNRSALAATGARIRLARLSSRFGRVELMMARARIGYARMLIYRRALASMSGRGINAAYAARPVAEHAVAQLSRLPGGTERDEALFEAWVVLALAWQYVGAVDRAHEALTAARRLDPRRAEADATFLYTHATLETRLLPKLQSLRRAVERDPRFQAAQYDLAFNTERLWRSRETIEARTADAVLLEYSRLLELNPGIIGGWAAIGYIRWLLGRDDAQAAYGRALDYKDIERETFVSEVDYGLARIAAESGDFVRAYDHYVRAVSALFANGMSHGEGKFTGYYFESINDDMLRRFADYRRKVEEHRADRKTVKSVGSRVADSIYAFVLNDHGEALYNAYLRAGRLDRLDDAESAFRQAIQLSTNFLLPRFNLYRVLTERRDDDAALEQLEEILRRDHTWVDATLEAAKRIAEAVRRAPGQSTKLHEEASAAEEQASQLRLRAKHGETPPEAEEAEREAREKREQAALVASSVPRRQEESLELIRALLPHAWLRNGDASLIDARGRSVERLLADRTIDWARELDDLHVDALSVWAEVLSFSGDVPAMEAAAKLASHLAGWFRPRDVDLLDISRRSAQGRLSVGDGVVASVARRAVWEAGGLDAARSALAAAREMRAAVTGWVEEEAGFARASWLNWVANALLELGEAVSVRPRRSEVARAAAAVRTAGRLPRRRALAPSAIWCRRRRLGRLEALGARAAREVEALFIAVDAYAEASLALDRLARLDVPHAALDAGRGKLRLADVTEQLAEPVDAALQCLNTLPWNGKDTSAPFAPGAVLEASAGLRRLRPRLLTLTNGAVADREGAVALLRRAYALAGADGSLGDLRGRAREELCTTLWILGRPRDALRSLADERSGDECDRPWRAELVDALLPHVTERDQDRLLRSWLAEQAAICTAAGAEVGLADVLEARIKLHRSVHFELRRDISQSAWLSVSTYEAQADPVTVEGHDDLFPPGVVWPTHPLFIEYIPAMRERVLQATGIRVPGVRFRPMVDGSVGEYAVLIFDVPVERGWVRAGRLALDPEACAALGLSGVVEHGGMWLSEDDAIRAARAGIPVLDTFQFLVGRLEAVVRREAHRFVDADETRRLLETGQEGPGAARIRRLLADPAALSRLGYALRRLAREGVPLTQVDRIVAEADEPVRRRVPADELAERLRLAFRAELPGSNGDRGLVALEPQLEQRLARGRSRRNWTFQPGESANLLEALRRVLGRQPGSDLALVVRQPGMRSLVQSVVASEFPGIPVLSAEELDAEVQFVDTARADGGFL